LRLNQQLNNNYYIERESIMKKFSKTPLAVAMGTAVISGFAANVSADSNPFAISELSSGYMVAEASSKVAQAICGSNAMDANGNVVSKSKSDTKGNKGNQSKKAEGSCGEGMCGGMMSGGKMKKGMEGMCGEMMKGKEGSCGMMGGGMGNMGDMNHGDADTDKSAKGNEGSCGAMMGGEQKGGEGSCGGMMKGGEGSCGSKVDADKAAGK
jgi:uncharacterized low-complexity protein